MKHNYTPRILILIFIIFHIFNTTVYSQNDTLNLKEAEIMSSRVSSVYSESARVIQIITRDEIAEAPVQSLQDLLEYALNVDVRQRGNNGVQADVSIRGGSTEQCLILLNGVKMNDPQTGHHTMNLPVDIQDIDRIEILEGPGARIYGANAFTGAINIITANQKTNRLKISSVFGEYRLCETFASLSLSTSKIQNYFSISRKSSDGYINNTDFNLYNLFYQNKLQFKKASVNFQTGYNNKAFGANSFYSAKYPNQFEETKTFFANANLKTEGWLKFTSNIYYRQNKDKFELFRNNSPSWYLSHNYHFTEIYGVEVNLTFNTCLGKTAFGGEVRTERIKSNVLGEPIDPIEEVSGESGKYYTKGHHRENLGLFAEQNYIYKNFSISGGLYANFNSDFNRKICAGIDASYDISGSWKYFASVNQSMRMPTYTDLYYVGPTNKGNINLKPEEAIAYETGVKFFSKGVNAHIAVFRRDADNLIDWVRLPDSNKWESHNLTQIITNGFEFSSQINLQNIISKKFFINSIKLSYSYLDLEKNSNNYISYYVLDYLKHKLVADVEHRVYRRLKANWAICYQERMGSYTDINTNTETLYPKFVTIDVRVTYQQNKWNCFMEVSNLFDKKYMDFGNIQMPGRWIKGGVNITLNLEKKTPKKEKEVTIEVIEGKNK